MLQRWGQHQGRNKSSENKINGHVHFSEAPFVRKWGEVVTPSGGAFPFMINMLFSPAGL